MEVAGPDGDRQPEPQELGVGEAPLFSGDWGSPCGGTNSRPSQRQPACWRASDHRGTGPGVEISSHHAKIGGCFQSQPGKNTKTMLRNSSQGWDFESKRMSIFKGPGAATTSMLPHA